MSKATKVGLVLNVLLLSVVFGFARAQRPPEFNDTGAAYLRVNINPTNVPPMVNINPYQTVPRVEVTAMPDVRVPPTGCARRQSYQTGIGRSISGPLMITYLHVPDQTRVSLRDQAGSHS